MEPKRLLVPRTPGDFDRDGVLPCGVIYADEAQREFVIGPLTVERELAAAATCPDWIDYGLIYRLMVAKSTDADLAEQGIDRATVAPLSADEERRAARMTEMLKRHEARYRLVKLGAIPSADLADAAGRLLPADYQLVLDLAEEVDAAVARFHQEARTVLGRRGDAGPGGPADPDAGPSGI
jgi:hypothetical protein